MSDPIAPAAAAPATAPAAAAATAPTAGATALTAPLEPVAAVPAAARGAPAAPLSADSPSFKLPDDFKTDPALIAEYGKTFGELNIDAAGQQKLADVWAKTTRAQVAADRAASDAAWQKEQSELKAAAQADPEIGGDKWKPSVMAAQKALLKFGSPKLNALLDSSGLGNHPEVIRLLSKMGAGIAEDSLAGAGSNGAAEAQTAAAALRARYPSMFDAAGNPKS